MAETTLGTRMDALESRLEGMDSRISQTLEMILKNQIKSAGEDTASAPSATLDEKQQSLDAMRSLEGDIMRSYEEAASRADDGTLTLNPEQLKAVLNLLGSMPGGREVCDTDAADIMRSFDTDGNGVLDPEEFKPFLRSLVLQNRFQFRDELDEYVEVIARATREDPWASAMKSDPGMKSIFEGLRPDVRTKASSPSFKPAKGRRTSSQARRASAAPPSAGAPASAESASCSVAPFHDGPEGSVTWAPSPSRASMRMVPANSQTGLDVTARLDATFSLMCACLPVLHPDGRFRSSWNIIMALLIIYCGVVVPLEIAFEPTMRAQFGEAGWSAWEACNLVVDIAFLIDICFNFRSGYIAEGVRPVAHRATDLAAIAHRSSDPAACNPPHGHPHTLLTYVHMHMHMFTCYMYVYMSSLSADGRCSYKTSHPSAGTTSSARSS